MKADIKEALILANRENWRLGASKGQWATEAQMIERARLTVLMLHRLVLLLEGAEAANQLTGFEIAEVLSESMLGEVKLKDIEDIGL